jgi:hypothetical protein
MVTVHLSRPVPSVSNLTCLIEPGDAEVFRMAEKKVPLYNWFSTAVSLYAVYPAATSRYSHYFRAATLRCPLPHSHSQNYPQQVPLVS